jgi:glycosyltransferase involved in cell wall biosynthesis
VEVDPECKIIAVFLRELTQDRFALGWRPPDYGKCRVLISPDHLTMGKLLQDDPGRTVHLFSGMSHLSAIQAVFKKALASKSLVGILSEGRDWRGWKGILRQTHALFHERRYRRSVDFVLAIGRVGVHWYDQCGFNKTKVFPLCYVTEASTSVYASDKRKSHTQLTATGRLIPGKRFDLVLNALKNISASEYQLKIIGDGERRSSLEHMANSIGLKDKVVFTGVLDNRQVMGELAQTDIFVFPSQIDGWGAVVNEALMSGVPVICNDYCGAADLIRDNFTGELFRCGDLNSLANALEKWILKGPLKESERARIKSWSQCIEGQAVARYFLEILDCVGQKKISKPKAPWM